VTELTTAQPAAVAPRPANVRDALARSLNIDPDQLVAVVKSQCFKGDPRSITNEQLTAFLSVAADLGVNPLLPGMLYAYPIAGGGIVPMIGPDGVYTMLARRPEYGGHRFEYEYHERTLVAVTCYIAWRGRELPVSKRIVVAEWEMGANPNWKARRTHMAETRALKQAARQVIHGLPWDEEERRIAQAVETPHVVVTSTPARGAAAVAARLLDDRPAEPEPLPVVEATDEAPAAIVAQDQADDAAERDADAEKRELNRLLMKAEELAFHKGKGDVEEAARIFAEAAKSATGKAMKPEAFERVPAAKRPAAIDALAKAIAIIGEMA
jgi:hypothetical protein